MAGATPKRRAVAIAVVVVAVAAGVGVALALSGDDDEPATMAETATTETATATETQPQRDTGDRPRATTRAPAPDRNEREIERTVSALVESVELGDGAAVCAALGRRGSGPEAIGGCARAAGVDLAALPTSDELSVGDVEVVGRRATAELAGGTTVSLRRVGTEWRVSGIEAGG
jgi:hypothetical protein